jgi:hypothetical protein
VRVALQQMGSIRASSCRGAQTVRAHVPAIRNAVVHEVEPQPLALRTMVGPGGTVLRGHGALPARETVLLGLVRVAVERMDPVAASAAAKHTDDRPTPRCFLCDPLEIR